MQFEEISPITCVELTSRMYNVSNVVVRFEAKANFLSLLIITGLKRGQFSPWY